MSVAPALNRSLVKWRKIPTGCFEVKRSRLGQISHPKDDVSTKVVLRQKEQAPSGVATGLENKEQGGVAFRSSPPT